MDCIVVCTRKFTVDFGGIVPSGRESTHTCTHEDLKEPATRAWQANLSHGPQQRVALPRVF